MSANFRDFRNRENPSRVDFRADEEAGIIEVKARGCPPARYVVEPHPEPGKRVRLRPVDTE